MNFGKKPLPEELNMPPSLFIEHEIEGVIIPQRPIDGYINATAMCQKAGKKFAQYHMNQSTQEFVAALSADVGIPTSAIIQVHKGGYDKQSQGTWVHPKVAIHLAQWLSPEFSVQVTNWVFEWMSGNISANMPYHLRRYVANMHKIPNGYFSMLNEIIYTIVAPLEQKGYILPAKLMPDISTGRMFSNFLRAKSIEPKGFPEYTHEFTEGGRPPVQARLYPNKYLGEFRDYMNDVWIPQRALSYFNERDKKALPYIKKALLPSPPEKLE